MDFNFDWDYEAQCIYWQILASTSELGKWITLIGQSLSHDLSDEIISFEYQKYQLGTLLWFVSSVNYV